MLGDNIKKLRNKKGIYQQDLADSLSVSKSTVAMWETNKREPDLTMLRKISIFFDVSIDDLLDFSKKEIEESLNSNNKESERVKILARHLQNIPEVDREQLIDTLESTIDIYLKAKGIK